MTGPVTPRSHNLPHFRELDGMRGLAALLVFFHHLCSATIFSNNWIPGILALRSIFEFGNVGVDIFFVLSGFLITSLLLRDRADPAYYRHFYWKRALRILPVYVLCLLGVLLFIPHSSGYVLLSTFFIANFTNVFHVDPVGPFWSLAIEEQFYLVWPTVIRRRSVRTLSHWALAIAAGSTLLRFAFAAFGHHNPILTFLHCDGLAIGALIACRYEGVQRERRSLSSDDPIFVTALLAGFVLCAIPLVLLSSASHVAIDFALFQTGVTFICGSLIGLIIAHTGSKVLSPFRGRVLTFFGLISYAFYMVHPYIMLSYDHLRGLIVPGDTRGYFIRLFAVFTLAIAVSLILRYLVELPALSLRKYVLTRPASKAGTASEAETEVPLLASQ